MFCQKCGSKILNGRQFCIHCGAKIAAVASPTVTKAVQTQVVHEKNTQLISEIKKILPYVKRVERDLSQIEALKSQMQEDAIKQRRAQEARDNFVVNHLGFVFTVFSIISIVIGLPLTLLTQVEGMLGVGAVAGGIITYKLCQKIKEPDTQHYDPVQEAEEKIRDLEQELREYCANSNISAALDIVPREYCYVEALEYLLRVLQTGRAETMKEALNLYEEYMYREEMRSMQTQQSQAIDGVSEQIDLQTQLIENQGRQLSEQLGQVQRTANKAKRAAHVNTALNVYGLLKR